MPLPGALAGRYFPSALPFGAAGAYARILRVLSAIAAAARLKPRRAVRCMARAPLCNAPLLKPRHAPRGYSGRQLLPAPGRTEMRELFRPQLPRPRTGRRQPCPRRPPLPGTGAGMLPRRLCANCSAPPRPVRALGAGRGTGSCTQPFAVCSVSALRYKSRAHPQAPAAETHRWFRSRSGLRRRAPACLSARR